MWIDEEVLAVLLSIVVVIGVLLASQIFIAGKVVNPFSEIAILGPEMKLAGYPKQLTAGEPFTLHVYIGNHEGKTMNYSVLVKLGNESTPVNSTHPLQASLITSFNRILIHGENATEPLTLRIDRPGLNQRLVFELWRCDESPGTLEYYGRFLQLWMNVTKPAEPTGGG